MEIWFYLKQPPMDNKFEVSDFDAYRYIKNIHAIILIEVHIKKIPFKVSFERR